MPPIILFCEEGSMAYNYNQTTWMNPNIQYLFDEDITEFDIKDAGYSLIQEFHLLPDEEIQRLSKLEKGITRHIEVGKLQRDNPEFSNKLSTAFAEARKFFIEMNGINDDDIVSVKKDAIFIIGPAKHLKFGKIQFVPKNKYSSYIRFPHIHNIEIYYNSDHIDFKQINDHCIDRHRIYMVEFLKKYISKMENRDPSIKRFMIKFIMDYKSLQLDEEYYLEFNNKSAEINPLFNYKEILIPLLSIINKEVA